MMSLGIVVCFVALIVFYVMPYSSQIIEERTIEKLDSLVDIPYNIVEKYHTAFEAGTFNEKEAKQKAIEEISALRYSSGEYFWINDYKSVMVLHPINPELIGENMSGFEDANGTMIFEEMTALVRKDGQGILRYYWTKPNSDTPEPKVSYVEGFEPWGWIIGTGIYMGDVQLIQSSMYSNVLRMIVPVILGIILFSVLFSYLINRSIKALNEVAVKVAEGDLDVVLNTNAKDEIGDLTRSFEKIVNTVQTVVDESRQVDDEIRRGLLDSSVDLERFSGGWKDIMTGMNSIVNTLEGHVRKMPAIFLTIDTEFNVRYMNEAGLSTLGISKNVVLDSKCYDLFKTTDCKTDNCACGKAMREKRNARSETTASPNGTPIEIAYEGIPLRDKAGQVIGAFEFVVDQTEIIRNAELQDKRTAYQSNEVNKLIGTLGELANGKLNISTSADEHDDETAMISENFDQIYDSLRLTTRTIRSYINEISEVLSSVSNKNLDVGISREYMGDFADMKQAINGIVIDLNAMLSDFNSSAKQVADGSIQVAQSAQELSQGSTEQAGAIQQINASMTRISEQTKQNALNASKASELSEEVKNTVASGNEKMHGMLGAMGDISEASSSIASIIKVIDDIAFQTNILALNAAVEAARAGEHGKGFAVVAEEVRNLAARSAGAAKETTRLIEDSMRKVHLGTEFANETSTILDKIMHGTTETTTLINDISEASNQQSEMIEQIDEGIDQVSMVTQGNAANSEESAAASEEMSAQAEALEEMISVFNLKTFDHSILSSHMQANQKRIGQSSNLSQTEELQFQNIRLDDEDFGKY